MIHYLDLDNFKAINDRFGHPAGDCLLEAVAVRLQELVRASDTVARLGGDEFVVLSEDLDDPEAAARALAERIHHAMRAPIPLGERNLHTSVSIGIAQVLPHQDPEVCLAQADAAMYQAKRGGPARFESYNEVIGTDNQRRSQLADELRVAAELGQLSVHYQPLFAIAGSMVGVEALLRWQHPELGSVPPSEFIPLLEQSREIIPVGRWVLEEATTPVPDLARAGFRPAGGVGERVGSPAPRAGVLRRRGERARRVRASTPPRWCSRSPSRCW